jgi:hypothetical protein
MRFDIRKWRRDRRHIVLVGGQCSGKSKALHRIRKRWKEELRYIPEIAGFVRRQFRYDPKRHANETQARVQEGIYTCQLWVEYAAHQAAAEGGCRAVIGDRGTLDGSVYHPGGVDAWCDACGTSVEFEYARYDHVIYLEQAPEDVYSRRSEKHTERQPSLYPVAHERAERLLALWRGHPGFHFVPFQEAREAKSAAVLDLLSSILHPAAEETPGFGLNSGFTARDIPEVIKPETGS